MANIKLYYLSQANFDAKIKNAKLPLQQIQIYRALAAIGKPTRGVDVIDKAVKEYSLQTKQDYAVLAAWYFSDKRRPECVTRDVPVEINEDLADKITRLTAEIEAKQEELALAELEFSEQAETEEEEAKEDSEDEQPAA
jgi:hypothetical protein